MQIEHIVLIAVVLMILAITSSKRSIDKTIPKDPVKHCKIYRNFGCSHVDGFLCNVDTCKVSITVFPDKVSIGQNNENRPKERINQRDS